MAAERASAKRARILIFVTALVLRATAGALFFGSVDIINSVINSIAISQGKTIGLPLLSPRSGRLFGLAECSRLRARFRFRFA